MKNKNLRVIFVILTLLCGLSITAAAQGRGQSGRGQTVGRGNQDRDRTTDSTRDRTRDRDTTRDRDRDLSGDRDRDRIRANDRQRDQLQTGIDSADRIRQQTRDMIRDCDNPNFSSADAKMQRERLHNQIRNLEQNQERLMAGLNDYQRNRFQKNIRSMEQIHSRIHNQMQLMEQGTNDQNFNRKMHRNQIREIDKAMKRWQKQYREIARDMADN
ncbi:MAG: hypothetical protein JSS81_16850 [Acidobacteria bacterium]|nr:hypothetical protein [Acidobacteriota bacterium]